MWRGTRKSSGVAREGIFGIIDDDQAPISHSTSSSQKSTLNASRFSPALTTSVTLRIHGETVIKASGTTNCAMAGYCDLHRLRRHKVSIESRCGGAWLDISWGKSKEEGQKSSASSAQKSVYILHQLATVVRSLRH